MSTDNSEFSYVGTEKQFYISANRVITIITCRTVTGKKNGSGGIDARLSDESFEDLQII